MSTETRAAMLAYLRRGWSVFPLTPRDKCPHGRLLPTAFDATEGRDKPTWKHYQAAPPAATDVHRWCSADPALNVGIVTGRVSRLLVLDCDGPGAVAWAEAQGLPTTPTSSTSPGKRHYLFAYPRNDGQPIGNKAALETFDDGSKIDIRAEGGYIVAAPSIHPDGHAYTWLVSPDEADPAPCPAWLLDLLRPPQQHAAPLIAPTRRAPSSSRGEERRARYAETALAGELDKLARAADGTRNDCLFAVTRRLYNLHAAGVLTLSESDLDSAIESAARQNGMIADDGEHAFTKTLASGKRTGLRDSLPELPDFDAADDEPETQQRAAPVATASAGDDEAPLAAELERHRRFVRDVKRVLTADKDDGWQPTTKLALLYTQLELFERGETVATLDGGARAVARAVGISADTASNHLKKLEAAGLVDWYQSGPIYCDRNRDEVDCRRVDHTRTLRDQGLHVESVSLLAVQPLPDELPPVAVTAYQERKRQQAQSKRDELNELRETVERLEAARCPCCGETGTLRAACSACGSIVTAETIKEMALELPTGETVLEVPTGTPPPPPPVEVASHPVWPGGEGVGSSNLIEPRLENPTDADSGTPARHGMGSYPSGASARLAAQRDTAPSSTALEVPTRAAKRRGPPARGPDSVEIERRALGALLKGDFATAREYAKSLPPDRRQHVERQLARRGSAAD